MPATAKRRSMIDSPSTANQPRVRGSCRRRSTNTLSDAFGQRIVSNMLTKQNQFTSCSKSAKIPIRRPSALSRYLRPTSSSGQHGCRLSTIVNSVEKDCARGGNIIGQFPRSTVLVPPVCPGRHWQRVGCIQSRKRNTIGKPVLSRPASRAMSQGVSSHLCFPKNAAVLIAAALLSAISFWACCRRHHYPITISQRCVRGIGRRSLLILDGISFDLSVSR